MSAFTDEMLMSPNFDEASYLQYILHTGGYQGEEEVQRLESCITRVKEQLTELIQEHRDSIVEHVRITYQAQQDVEVVRESAESLVKAKERLAIMIQGPYAAIQSHLTELENTAKAEVLLRDVTKFFSLMSKLNTTDALMSTAGRDAATTATTGTSAMQLLQQARTLHEIDQLLKAADIRSIQVVEDQIATYERAVGQVRATVNSLLKMSSLLEDDELKVGAPTDGAGEAVKGDPKKLKISDVSSSSAVRQASSTTIADVGLALMCANALESLHSTTMQFMNDRKMAVLRAVGRELQLTAIQQCAQRLREREVPPSSSAAGKSGTTQPQHPLGEAILHQLRLTLRFTIRQTQCVLAYWRVLLSKYDPIAMQSYLEAMMREADDKKKAQGSGAVSSSSPPDPAQMVADFLMAVLDKLRDIVQSLQGQYELADAWPSLYAPFMLLLHNFLRAGQWITTFTARSAAVSPYAAALVPRESWGCGLADLVDLLQAVDTEATALRHTALRGGSRCMRPHPAGGGALPPPPSSFSSSSSSPVAARGASGGLISGSGAVTAQFHASAIRENFFSGWLSDMGRLLQARLLKEAGQRQKELVKPILSTFYALLEGAQSQPQALASNFIPTLPRATAAAPPPGSSSIGAPAFDCDMSRLFVKQLQEEVARHRSDPYGACVVLYAVLHALHQWTQTWAVAHRRFPMPPEPAVTGQLTRVQLVHLCVGNMCSAMLEGVLEMGKDLSVFPGTATISGMGAGEAAADPSMASPGGPSLLEEDERGGEILEGIRLLQDTAGTSPEAAAEALAGCSIETQLCCQRRHLESFVPLMQQLFDKSVLPFMASGVRLATEWVPRCVTEAVAVAAQQQLISSDTAEASSLAAGHAAVPSGGYSSASTMLPQLLRLLTQFRGAYYLAVHPRNPSWARASRNAMDTVLCQVLTESLLHPLPSGTNIASNARVSVGRSALQHYVKGMAAVLPTLVDHLRVCGVTRSTIVLEGTTKQLELLYSTLHTERVALLQPPPPPPLPASDAPPPTAALSPGAPQSPTAAATAGRDDSPSPSPSPSPTEANPMLSVIPPPPPTSAYQALASVLQTLHPLVGQLLLLQQLSWELQAAGHGAPNWPQNLLQPLDPAPSAAAAAAALSTVPALQHAVFEALHTSARGVPEDGPRSLHNSPPGTPAAAADGVPGSFVMVASPTAAALFQSLHAALTAVHCAVPPGVLFHTMWNAVQGQ